MHRRSIIFLVILAIVFLAVAVYFVPSITPVEVVLNAVKIDDAGNELGTAKIIMIGSKLDYLFQPSRIDVNIQPFDGITAIEPTDVHTKYSTIPGMIQTLPSRDFLYAYYSCIPDGSGYSDGVYLGFSPDLDRWIFRIHHGNVSYVASVSGNWTTQELVEYFDGLI